MNATNFSQYGSMTSKFSLSGVLLAFHCTSYQRSNHEIIVMNVKNFQIVYNLIGHLNIVYDLDWLNDHTLVSVSSDRTAIVWSLKKNGKFTLKVSSLRYVHLLPLKNKN